MIKFSIITPSYNQGRFLPDCVESVLAQVDASKEQLNICHGEEQRSRASTEAHEERMTGARSGPLAVCGQGDSDFSPPGFTIEHIVTDAGSTDDTVDVLKRYPHLQWTSEKDKGMSDGINKGFLKATGDWMMWLNCDDYLLPGALDKVAEFIRMNPDVDVVHGDCIFVNEDKSLIRRKYDHPVDEKMLLFVGCYIPSTSTFIRRPVISSGNLLDITYRVCMDWEYYLRLIRKGYRFGYIPEAIAGFRWHDTNTSLVQAKRRHEEALMLQREHIALSNLPSWLGNRHLLELLRKAYQVRRVARRKKIHRRWH